MTDPVKCTQCDALIKDMPKHLAKRHSGAKPPSFEAGTAPAADPEADTGFAVDITVQDFTESTTRHTFGKSVTRTFVGVDAKSNIAHFLAGRREQETALLAALAVKGNRPVVRVKGYQFVRYDGARGSWYNANLADQKGR